MRIERHPAVIGDDLPGIYAEGAVGRVLYVVHGARHLVRLFRRERRE